MKCEMRNAKRKIPELIARSFAVTIGHETTLENRTKRFAIDVIQFITSLRMNPICDVISRQLPKSGTSIGANYREASRAESHDDFIHKIAICAKESAETQDWLELFLEAGLEETEKCKRLRQAASELLAIFIASGRTAKGRRS